MNLSGLWLFLVHGVGWVGMGMGRVHEYVGFIELHLWVT